MKFGVEYVPEFAEIHRKVSVGQCLMGINSLHFSRSQCFGKGIAISQIYLSSTNEISLLKNKSRKFLSKFVACFIQIVFQFGVSDNSGSQKKSILSCWKLSHLCRLEAVGSLQRCRPICSFVCLCGRSVEIRGRMCSRVCCITPKSECWAVFVENQFANLSQRHKWNFTFEEQVKKISFQFRCLLYPKGVNINWMLG